MSENLITNYLYLEVVYKKISKRLTGNSGSKPPSKMAETFQISHFRLFFSVIKYIQIGLKI